MILAPNHCDPKLCTALCHGASKQKIMTVGNAPSDTFSESLGVAVLLSTRRFAKCGKIRVTVSSSSAIGAAPAVACGFGFGTRHSGLVQEEIGRPCQNQDQDGRDKGTKSSSTAASSSSLASGPSVDQV